VLQTMTQAFPMMYCLTWAWHLVLVPLYLTVLHHLVLSWVLKTAASQHLPELYCPCLYRLVLPGTAVPQTPLRLPPPVLPGGVTQMLQHYQASMV
jgi:hypothetical protein